MGLAGARLSNVPAGAGSGGYSHVAGPLEHRAQHHAKATPSLAARGTGPRSAARTVLREERGDSDLSDRVAASPTDELVAARACWIEASFNESDCAAIVYALAKRAQRRGWAFARMALAYSALKARNDRAARARALPAGDEPSFSASENRAWSRVRETAAAALERRTPNPCPGATHWNARLLPREAQRAVSAVEAGTWRAVRCVVPTANDFYTEAQA